MLEINNLSKNFGALAAIKDVSISVEGGERMALVGPNGAGKTTLFNLISGEIRPDTGRVRLKGVDVTGRPPEHMVTSGLGRTFQRNSLFLENTVYENVRLAVQRRLGIRFQLFRSVERYAQLEQETNQVLDRVRLAERSLVLASELSYGEQRQLELGITLATSPKVLLLDEPTAGMSSTETREMVSMLKLLPEEITVIVIEHDMDVVEALAGRIVVLNFGEILADGAPEEVRENKEVLAAYLGVAPDEGARNA